MVTGGKRVNKIASMMERDCRQIISADLCILTYLELSLPNIVVDMPRCYVYLYILKQYFIDRTKEFQ